MVPESFLCLTLFSVSIHKMIFSICQAAWGVCHTYGMVGNYLTMSTIQSIPGILAMNHPEKWRTMGGDVLTVGGDNR